MNTTNTSPLARDRFGRLVYTPELFPKKGQPWTMPEQKYLIENYESIGPEAMSLALERPTIGVMQRVSELRKKGLMPYPKKRVCHKRK
jgi:hypothetical protein